MSSQLADLLRRYERERVDQQATAREFAQRFPAEAASLGLSNGIAEHPQTRALLDAISFANARTQESLELSQQQLARDLLSVMFPLGVSPLPPLTIVQFDYHASADDQPAKPSRIPRGTTLLSKRVGSTRCQFQTTFDVAITPVRVLHAGFNRQINMPPEMAVQTALSGDISITLSVDETAINFQSRDLPSLRIFVDADSSLSATLRDCLFMHTSFVCLQAGEHQKWIRLQHVPVTPVGYAENQAVIPDEARAHPAHRLLQEYFAYPEKFNFFDIDLTEIATHLSARCQQFTLHFLISFERRDTEMEKVLSPLSARHLLLGCSPAVNLFQTTASPIYQDYTKSEYALIANNQHPADFEIYRIDHVTAMKKSRSGVSQNEYHPYYSLKHGNAGGRRGLYWYSRRDERLAEISPGFETYISFVDIDLDPLDTDISTVSVALRCTNRDLAQHLAVGDPDGDFQMTKGLGSYPIRQLRRATPTRRTPSTEHWRLISHLSANLTSLLKADVIPLKELLTLYDPAQSPATRGQIDGLVKIETQSAFQPHHISGITGYIFGTRIIVTINEDAYTGSGLHSFAQLLDHLFGLSTQLNTFVRLSIRSQQTGKELIQCLSRSGYHHIL